MEKQEGRPMHEVRRLLAEDSARFDRLAEVWNDLLPSEQEQLIAFAEKLKGGGG